MQDLIPTLTIWNSDVIGLCANTFEDINTDKLYVLVMNEFFLREVKFDSPAITYRKMASVLDMWYNDIKHLIPYQGDLSKLGSKTIERTLFNENKSYENPQTLQGNSLDTDFITGGFGGTNTENSTETDIRNLGEHLLQVSQDTSNKFLSLFKEKIINKYIRIGDYEYGSIY